MPRTKQTAIHDFDRFWNLYALKRDKVAAQRAWQRLSAADRRAAIDGIQAYRDACQQRGIAMMYPQGYLNHRRWEDEAEAAPSKSIYASDTVSGGSAAGNGYYDSDTGMGLW